MGILWFYSGVSAVMVGSTASSAVYFGTCEFDKSILSKFDQYTSMLIPPTAGATGNIISSVIMVPKELITQRMQADATGRSWQPLLKLLEKLGQYAGYSATLLRNLPAGVLSYSSFKYLKTAVLSKTNQTNLEPFQSVPWGIGRGNFGINSYAFRCVKDYVDDPNLWGRWYKMAVIVYDGVRESVKQILKEEGWVGFTQGMGPTFFSQRMLFLH